MELKYPVRYYRKFQLACLTAEVLALKVHLCELEADNILGRHDSKSWADFERKWAMFNREFEFWKMLQTVDTRPATG